MPKNTLAGRQPSMRGLPWAGAIRALLVALALLVWVPPADAGDPCCSITAINIKTGMVSAKETATGRTFQFKATPQLAGTLKVGQPIHADFKSMQASVRPDGSQPCCNVVNLSAPGVAAGRERVFGASPCCNITAINPKTGLVTAVETGTKRTFQFKATDTKVLKTLKVGQPVYANFPTQQVSVDGATPCCAILQ